jgi:hypothetical protein
MFVNQRKASKMVEVVMKTKLATEKKKKKARAAIANKGTAPEGAFVIKTLTSPSNVIVTKKASRAAASNKAASTAQKAVAKAAPPADDASDSTELTYSTGTTESTRSIDAIVRTIRIPGYNKIMAVVGSWDKLKAQKGYEEALGKQIILKMMEIEPCTRDMLGLTSLRSAPLRSARFATVSINMVGMIDVMVSFLGPGMERIDDDLLDVGTTYISEGFNAELFPILSRSVCSSLKVVLAEDFSSTTENAWKAVIDFMAIKMSPIQQAVYIY